MRSWRKLDSGFGPDNPAIRLLGVTWHVHIVNYVFKGKLGTSEDPQANIVAARMPTVALDGDHCAEPSIWRDRLGNGEFAAVEPDRQDRKDQNDGQTAE